MCNKQPEPRRRGGSRTAADLGLPQGEAVIRKGKVEIIPATQQIEPERRANVGPAVLPTAAISTQRTFKSNEMDRAQAFNLTTNRLALVVCFLGGIIAVWRWDAPIISLMTVGGMFTGYALVWIVAWILHQLIGPDGTTFVQALLGYRIIRKEQEFRHRRQ